MTDDEIKLYLRPRHNWVAIGGFVVAMLGSAAALGKWIFQAPTREDYSGLENRTKGVELDHAVLKATVDGLRSDVAKQDNHLELINVKIDKLLDRRGGHDR